MSADNVQTVQKMYQAFGSGDVDAMLSVLTDDIEWKVNLLPSIPIHGDYKGHAGVTDFVGRIVDNVEVIEFAPTEILTQDNLVLVHGHERLKVKKTGREVYNEWVQVFQCDGGKISVFQSFNDVAAVDKGYNG